jgi:hypothetical protein
MSPPPFTCTQAGGGDVRELAAFTPSFLWLLRDFYLKLEDEHGQQVAVGVC